MSLVGTSVERVGIRAKVSGAINYTADLQFTGQIYAKALRSPYAHAKLLRIDATKAAACAGVHAVVTREDLADLNPCFGTSVEFFFSSRRRHTRSLRDWSSDVCSSD